MLTISRRSIVGGTFYSPCKRYVRAAIQNTSKCLKIRRSHFLLRLEQSSSSSWWCFSHHRQHSYIQGKKNYWYRKFKWHYFPRHLQTGGNKQGGPHHDLNISNWIQWEDPTILTCVWWHSDSYPRDYPSPHDFWESSSVSCQSWAHHYECCLTLQYHIGTISYWDDLLSIP